MKKKMIFCRGDPIFFIVLYILLQIACSQEIMCSDVNLFTYFVSKKKCDQSDFNLGIIAKIA